MQYECIWEHKRAERDKRFTITEEEPGVFRVAGPQVERMVVQTDWENEEAVTFLQHRLKRVGVDDALAPRRRPGRRRNPHRGLLLRLRVSRRGGGRVPGAGYLMSEKANDGARRRLVVKIGSSTLTTSESSIDYGFLDNLAAQLAQVRSEGWDVVVVTSAAIACGLEALGIAKRPTDMPSLQAAASVGQSALSTAYSNAFAKEGMLTSVVLLTRRDTADRNAYLHARDTLNRLLELGVVPVVNENDTVSVEQIRFGDNDTLAALVACLIDADLIVILSDIDGMYTANPQSDPSATLIPRIDRIDRSVLAAAGGAGSTVGSGGMVAKTTGGSGIDGRRHSHGHLPRAPVWLHRRRGGGAQCGHPVRGSWPASRDNPQEVVDCPGGCISGHADGRRWGARCPGSPRQLTSGSGLAWRRRCFRLR